MLHITHFIFAVLTECRIPHQVAGQCRERNHAPLWRAGDNTGGIGLRTKVHSAFGTIGLSSLDQ